MSKKNTQVEQVEQVEQAQPVAQIAAPVLSTKEQLLSKLEHAATFNKDGKLEHQLVVIGERKYVVEPTGAVGEGEHEYTMQCNKATWSLLRKDGILRVVRPNGNVCDGRYVELEDGTLQRMTGRTPVAPKAEAAPEAQPETPEPVVEAAPEAPVKATRKARKKAETPELAAA
jgi:hypothetical protein